MYDYEWDPQKALINLNKHGVSFAEAAVALEDEQAITLEDDYPDEQRFITMGMDGLGRVLVVIYTYRFSNIRIISARKATPNEQRTYFGRGNV